MLGWQHCNCREGEYQPTRVEGVAVQIIQVEPESDCFAPYSTSPPKCCMLKSSHAPPPSTHPLATIATLTLSPSRPLAACVISNDLSRSQVSPDNLLVL